MLFHKATATPILVRFLREGFQATGALWLLVRIVDYFSPRFLESEGLIWLFASSVVAWGIWRAWPSQHIDLTIPGTDSSCEIKFGDVFDGPGVVVIPVNEYFDAGLGDHVSPNSLHGKFIKDVMAGHSGTFSDLTSRALAGTEPEESNVERPSGRRDRYAIGTAASVDFNEKRYLLVALSRTDLQTLKATATVLDLWPCLEGVWNGARNHSNGEPVKIPLIGSGLSGVGLPPGKLIDIVITSFLCCTKERRVADRVTLVLPDRLKYNLDLDEIQRHWS